MVHSNALSIDFPKCIQHAFDRQSRHRKSMYRAMLSILDLAKQRGYTRSEHAIQSLKESSPTLPSSLNESISPSRTTLQREFMREIYEFVSPEECSLLIQGFMAG